LKAETLDSWREYTLLRIIDTPLYSEVNGSEVEEEPIHLLKMVCPSTAHIHVLRVPPDIYTAREAIRWVNWDTDPQEFAVAT
jgi:internalin A